MLDSLRRGANTWAAKILLVLLVASFAVWGIAGSVTDFTSKAVASVGDTEVDAAAFSRAYDAARQQLSTQVGQPVSAEQAAAFGLPQRVLGQMMSEAALTDAADRLGLGISDERLAAEIAADPSLQRGGRFDRAYFNQLLRSINMNEATYVADRRENEKRGQLIDGLFGAVAAPAAFTEAIVGYRTEVRGVDYIKLTPESVGEIAPPSDETLQAFFTANARDFQAPEYRKLLTLTLTPEAVADPAAVSAADVEAEYRRNESRYGAPERRKIEQILYGSLEEAEAARAKIDAGAAFEDLLADKGMTAADADLGTVAKSAVADPAVAEAAFALPAGEVSAPVTTAFGAALVRVDAVEPAATRPLAEVEDEIRRELALVAAQRATLDLYEDIEDALAGGSTLTEVAGRYQLQTREIEAIDATGRAPDGSEVADLPQAPGFLGEVFQSDVGIENAPLQLGRYGYVWYEVASVTPARTRDLDEVRDQVVARWTADERARLLDARASEIFAEVEGGKPLVDVAIAAGSLVATSEKFTRGARNASIGPDAVEAAFGGPEGHVALSAGPGDSRLILEVKTVVPVPYFAESTEAKETTEKLAAELQNSLLVQYIDHVEKELGTRVNQQLLQSAIGLGGR